MDLINRHDWRTLGESFRNAEPFPSICIDNFLDPDFALEVARSYPEFSQAQHMGREFSTVNEKGKIQITDSKRFPEPVSRLHAALADQSFLEGMQTLSGIDKLTFDDEFAGGGMHMTRKSGILDVHVDFNYSERLNLYRRLNLLIYLNEEWGEDWGGNIELWDKDVKNCVSSHSPIFNRCLIFATSDMSFHGVTAVTAPPGVNRKSFALYLYNESPSHAAHGEAHSTVFRARPNETIKRYLQMPAEKGRRNLMHAYSAGKAQVKRLLGR